MVDEMKAIVKTNPEPGAQIKEVKVPEVKPNEIMVRVKAAAICGTDRHIMDWTEYAQERIKTPMIFGHEFAGEVVEVGDRVENIKPGNRIAGETHLPCGNCRLCNTGLQHICKDMKILGVDIPGVFSEFAVIPENLAWKLPENISFNEGAMFEPVGVATHAIMLTNTESAVVLVTGCGPIGLAAIKLAKLGGAKKIIASGTHPERRELAQKWGADQVVDPNVCNLPSEVNQSTDNLGAEIVIEASGAMVAIEEAFASLRNAGEIILLGLPSGRVNLDIANDIIYKEANVLGMTGRIMWETWYQLQDMVVANMINPEDLITDTFPMSEFEEAFELVKTSTRGKILLYPGE